MLADPGQGEFDLGVAPGAQRTTLIGPASDAGLFEVAGSSERGPAAVAAPRVVSTASRVLYEALASVFTCLGFDALDDKVFRDLAIARIVEPTSIRDTGRVLTDLGCQPASEKTMRRTLTRAHTGAYRDQIARLCFAHAMNNGDVSLCLYDVTTLYFEAEKEDDLRRVGYSKERRVDPQIVVGLLVDRHGFPLEIGCFAGSKAETLTLLPVIRQFQARHQITGMVIVADAGMLSATNLRELDDAGLGFIVGSRTTKAPIDLESHYRWHGDHFTDGQTIDTVTPRTGANRDNDPALKAEPVWHPKTHTRSWRAVWAYSASRAARDNRTLNAQEAKARAVIAGEKAARTPRFVTINGDARTLDEASLARARKLVGLSGSPDPLLGRGPLRVKWAAGEVPMVWVLFRRPLPEPCWSVSLTHGSPVVSSGWMCVSDRRGCPRGSSGRSRGSCGAVWP
ncbi:IS1634 family transposase [Micromonospora sp. Llam0]|uniref:IS1634 family transposase n=1 Tax=Micromonospora sp. Llam0 TaxID=2485143 RepID=UPI001F25527C|nr:IS1634 family transposase [Micromonospora sp. Llam0]